MVSFTTAAISSAALLALVQFSPAPILGLPVVISIEMGSAAAWVGAAGGVAGAVTGAIGAAKGHRKREDVQVAAPYMHRVRRSQMKRQDPNSPEFNQLAWQECKTDVQSASLLFTDAGVGNVLVSGLPATCMTLATVLTGQFDEGNPVPMSSSSIQFNNVSDDTIQQIQSALDARGAA